MKTGNFLAFDLGASSGRGMLGTISNQTLKLTEIHRFENRMVEIDNHFYWNIFSIFDELKTGLKKCIRDFGIQPDSIAIDTWGVDFAFIDRDGMIASLPFAYRDHRTDTAMEEFYKIIPKEELYLMTGIQLMQFNSLFQLFVNHQTKTPQYETGKDLLFMPDALSYLFCGVKKNEFSIASTSQLLKPGKLAYEERLFKAMGVDLSIMQEIVLPGTLLGMIKPEVQKETGSRAIPVIAVASHDTASAIASVPASGKNWAYISSGTWSLMGIESDKPLISKEILNLNFTNEGGVEGTTRFLKNIMGMWLLQECRRVWSQEVNYSWNEMVDLSTLAQPFKCLIDPDDTNFLNPADMPEAITNYCLKTGQTPPQSHGEFIRCIFESLAMKYRLTLDSIRSVISFPIEKVHIIGGGANNELLCQYSANALGLPVVAGPAEATAIGNILIQAKAMHSVDSLEGIRTMVRNSFDTKTFEPQDPSLWETQLERFRKIVN
ncbi:MAG: rhamnulokinase [Bacteroidetes bacterium]|nr:rhamnulokinase [Bacteroidota bacterium]